jgi:opacity protein-like surface antigen
MTMKKFLLVLFMLLPIAANAQQAKVVQSCGTVPLTYPAGSTQYQTVDINGNLCTNAASSGTTSVKSGSYVSAGTGQFALAIGTNTQLTVPTGSVCAEITVEGANIRRTSDTTSATTTNGTLIQSGAQWQDCGPLAAYKFTAVSGSPTIDVEYFK